LEEPLVYKSAEAAPAAATPSVPASGTEASPAATHRASAHTAKTPGFFSRIRRFFRRIFGAE
jgi:hypothetical protein